MKKNALIVFVKNFDLGKVKTRLAASIGDEKAMQIYKYLVKHTLEQSQHPDIDTLIFFSERIELVEVFKPYALTFEVQKGNDLGERMEDAFTRGFNLGYEKIALIGSDCIELKNTHILEAINGLITNDVVIGPAFDGGYYLIALRKAFNELFQNKNWSTPELLKETIQSIKTHTKSHLLLELLNDVDEEHELTEELKNQINK